MSEDNIVPHLKYFALSSILRQYFGPLLNAEPTINFVSEGRLLTVKVSGGGREVSLTLPEAVAIQQDYINKTVHNKPFEWVKIDSFDELYAFYLTRLRPIRIAARACGYAIGAHGSMRRDMDLIAVPWVENHSDGQIRVKRLA